MSPLPLLDSRGGYTKKKILRSNHCRHRRGGCSSSNKTFEQPPPPRLVDASRLILMSRPPLLVRKMAHSNGFTPSDRAYSRGHFKMGHYAASVFWVEQSCLVVSYPFFRSFA